MNLITYEGGRILDLVPIEEIRPRGGVVIQDLTQAIADRYQFATVPSVNDASKAGAKFETGKFILDGKPVVIKELAVYNDGLISDAFDTIIAEAVLDDFLSWAAEKFELRERITPQKRTYTSAVVVEFKRDVESGFEKLQKICDLAGQALQASYGWDHKYNLNRLAVSVDPQAIPHLRSTLFAIERRPTTSYETNRYYSVAPLRSADHVALLQKIEDLF